MACEDANHKLRFSNLCKLLGSAAQRENLFQVVGTTGPTFPSGSWIAASGQMQLPARYQTRIQLESRGACDDLWLSHLASVFELASFVPVFPEVKLAP